MFQNEGFLKLLVIEDNPGDYFLIEEYLQEEIQDLNLTRAETFKEAKTYLETERFTAILLDMSLPDISNPKDLVKAIIPLAGNSPVVVLTGYADKNFGLQTLSMGVSDYLLKDEITSGILAKSIGYSLERKKVQAQLSNSEVKYRNLFEANPQPMWVLDKHSLCFLDVNPAATALYGYSREEFLKMCVRDLWAGEESRIEKVVAENYHDLFNLSVSHFKKNGEVIRVEVQSNPLVFEGREARVSLVTDVTARYKAERELQHSEERFRALVQDGSDLISILDDDLNYIYISPSVKQILGMEAEDFLGRSSADFIHPDDLDKVYGLKKYLGKKKRIHIPSYRYRSGNGEYRWLETIITDLRDEPAVNGLVSTARDITEFIEQQEKLKESLRRYEIVSKATSDLITDYHIPEDKMVFNEGIYEIFGYQPGEVGANGKWWDERVHPEDLPRVKRLVNSLYKEGNYKSQIEYRFLCANGEYKNILVRSYVIKDENNIPARIIGSMQDVTDRRKYIKAIEESNERLREIAWTQSHVVRAPLAKIMGLIDLLKNHRDDLDNINEILNNILSSSEELDKIIRKITVKTEK
ncbi:PAS domain S-box protein [Salegentibacter sp. HM20]